MIRYYRLFDLLNRRGMKKTDLLEIVSAGTLSKLSKGGNVQVDVIDKICLFLECQPSDIMECLVAESESPEERIVSPAGKEYIIPPNRMTNRNEVNEYDESEEVVNVQNLIKED